MKHVDIIRQRILRGMASELIRLRTFVSMTDGNTEVVARLEGKEGNDLLARVTENLLAELGHVTQVTADDPASLSRRRGRGRIAQPRGE